MADVRIHGATAESRALRFERDERQTLVSLMAKAPFLQVQELSRRVYTDACIELDTNRNSVPWKLIGEAVTVVAADQQVRVLYAGDEVACHAEPAAPRHRRRAQPSDRHRRRAPGRHELAVAASGVVWVAWLATSIGVPTRRAAAAAAGIRRSARGWLVMVASRKAKPIELLDDLEPMLTRLKLTAIRDQLDTLLDQAGRAELRLREGLAMLCAAEVAHKDERRIQMGLSIANFACVRTLDSFEYDAQSANPSVLGSTPGRAATGRRQNSTRRQLPNEVSFGLEFDAQLRQPRGAAPGIHPASDVFDQGQLVPIPAA